MARRREFVVELIEDNVFEVTDRWTQEVERANLSSDELTAFLASIGVRDRVFWGVDALNQRNRESDRKRTDWENKWGPTVEARRAERRREMTFGPR
jgi:hypothetical protein